MRTPPVVTGPVLPAVVLAVFPVGDWWDYLNPFTYLGNAAGKVAADAWTAAMLGLWNAGLWLLKLVLNIEDAFLTPDLSEAGPGRAVYQATFWIAGVLVLIMLMIQLGMAAFRRDGATLARAVIGAAQFVMVWAAWIGMAVAILAACGGLTRALLEALLHVEVMSAWQPFAGFSTKDITDGTIATVLGVMGIFLVFASIGHALVMLTRAGALMVLAATAPISAAGLVADAGRSWFWKSLRWFIAAAFTPVLMALVLGVGVQMTSGVVTGMSDDLHMAVGTALPGVLLILIGCFAPLALFKLLAFVDPATSSGAAMRTGLAVQGGLSGLLRGGGGSGTSDAASSGDGAGRSQAENAGQDATGSRFAKGVGAALGPVGAGVAAGIQMAGNTAARAAAIGADMTNQMGTGSPSYIPDVATTRRGGSPSSGGSNGPSEADNPDINGSGTPPSPPTPTPPMPPASTPTIGSSAGNPAAGPGAGAGAEAAAAVGV